jgi:hypothetical protein
VCQVPAGGRQLLLGGLQEEEANDVQADLLHRAGAVGNVMQGS